MGLGLTNFALEGGVSGRTSLKIEGKGNDEGLQAAPTAAI